ncbi:MAG TPA: SRPBCC family protein [Miltoncostaeaceae bacterium]|nr:SRPBCC family protein [Miltoncostaeaceae bacterium]
MSGPLGQVRAEGGRIGLRFERAYGARPEEIWAALTEAESIRRWLLAEAVLEPRVGGAFRLGWSGGEAAEGTVLAWEPPRLLEVEWADGDGRSVLRVEIAPSAGGAVLVLDHRDVPAGAAVSMGAGWDAHLTALGEALEGREEIAERWSRRYEALRPRYDELLSSP